MMLGSVAVSTGGRAEGRTQGVGAADTDGILTAASRMGEADAQLVMGAISTTVPSCRNRYGANERTCCISSRFRLEGSEASVLVASVWDQTGLQRRPTLEKMFG